LKLRYIVKFKRSDYYYLESGCNNLAVPFFALELVEKAKTNNPTTSDYYRTFHNASGLKVGDSVKVVRKAEDYEMGWVCCWVDEMDNYIGKTLEITSNSEGYGWLLEDKFYFPTFVLQKVDPAPIAEEIVINKDSAIVNGKVLTKEDIGKLYYRVVRGGKRVKKNKKTVVDNRVPLVPVHNPDNLTPEQYGASEGYRLLYADEIIKRKRRYKEIEAWDDVCYKNWGSVPHSGDSFGLTYRTKLSRKELAKLE